MACSMTRDTPLVAVSCKSVQYFVSDAADRQTYRQAQKHDSKQNLLGEGY